MPGIVYDSMHLINGTFEGFLTWNIETINSILFKKLNLEFNIFLTFSHWDRLQCHKFLCQQAEGFYATIS